MKQLIFTIEDTYDSIGIGLFVTGRVMCEYIKVGDTVIVDPVYLPEIKTKITQIVSGLKNVKESFEGVYVGIALEEGDKKQIKKKKALHKVSTS